MGQLDYNNYVIEVKLKDNVSDKRYDLIREKKPTIKEFQELEKELLATAPVYTKKAEDIIRFFLNYRITSFRPDKWNFYEPINKPIDYNDISKLVSCLAHPGGCIYLKKTRYHEIFIENHTHSFIWEDNQYLVPKRKLPIYLTTIKVYFSQKKNTDLNAIIQLMKDFKSEFGADNGKVYYQATDEIIVE
ncbi:MAG: hypothetical protein IKZ72_05920 [Bacteroidales bacterium]|nr:hypothetical protein [Bacteroidales bacterium]